MLVLFEASAGYAVFKVTDETKFREASDVENLLKTAEDASKFIKLKYFRKFDDTTEALSATTASVEGKVGKPLKKLLKKLVASDAHEKLAVADAKLGNAIQDKMDLMCIYSPAVHELMRGIRAHMTSLISGLPESDVTAMSLGLAHSLSRYKLKFSPDKVDTMIVQAISLLDDLDKELNNYIMRCREWYGWHFPELGKVVTDNLAFAKTVQKVGIRTNVSTTDLSEILPEEIEEQVKELAEISMGTEISEEDIANIKHLCEQIIEITDYRAQLYDYLKNRMSAIAPNLTILVGELVGARLIAHAGSLLNLAKHPASTVQILGAEKALFRALKTRKETPKYGLIYHASLVGQSKPQHKGRISRMLAAKTALAVRYDALAEETSTQMAIDNRALLEMKLKSMEEGTQFKISGQAKSKAKQQDKWVNKSEVKMYDDARDSTLPGPRKRKRDDDDSDQETSNKSLIVSEGAVTPAQPKSKKIKREPKAEDDSDEEDEEPKKKKKKSKKAQEDPVEEEQQDEEPKKKKKKSKKAQEDPVEEEQQDEEPMKKKKKSKKKAKTDE